MLSGTYSMIVLFVSYTDPWRSMEILPFQFGGNKKKKDCGYPEESLCQDANGTYVRQTFVLQGMW